MLSETKRLKDALYEDKSNDTRKKRKVTDDVIPKPLHNVPALIHNYSITGILSLIHWFISLLTIYL